MSEFEMLNQKTEAKKAAMRKETVKAIVRLFFIVLAVVLAFAGLYLIGFISLLFMVILISIAVCTGAFHAGRISIGYKR
jgi:fatty acid desaturase